MPKYSLEVTLKVVISRISKLFFFTELWHLKITPESAQNMSKIQGYSLECQLPVLGFGSNLVWHPSIPSHKT